MQPSSSICLSRKSLFYSMYVGFQWSQLIAKRHSSVYSKCRSCSCGSARKALPQHGVEFYSTITPIHGRSLHPNFLFIPMVRSRHVLFFGRLVPQQHTWRIHSDARHEETRHSHQRKHASKWQRTRCWGFVSKNLEDETFEQRNRGVDHSLHHKLIPGDSSRKGDNLARKEPSNGI